VPRKILPTILVFESCLSVIHDFFKKIVKDVRKNILFTDAVLCRSLFAHFRLAFVLFDLRFTASDYHFVPSNFSDVSWMQ
jgi:hypothetical protein